MLLRESDLVGEIIGDFRIIEMIGQGAMASVYRALDTECHQYVAVKIPDPRYAEKGDFAGRFIRESRAMALLDHPGIVRIQGLVEHERALMLVMEYVEGKSLARILSERTRIPVADAIGYVLQVCEAIAYAHGRGVIHRDLKPSNILIDSTGCVKVVDFGISKIISTTTCEETITFVGTPVYMSPEQCGEGVLDLRTDIYSIGIILYEMLVGKPPFCGSTAAEIIRGHLLETPKFPKNGEVQLPPKVIKIIRKMLAKDPTNRYADATEVAADLGSYTARSADSSKNSKKPPPMILCHVPQRIFLNAVRAALPAECAYEDVPRVGELLARIEDAEVDAVILGAGQGDSTIFKLAERIRKKSRNPKLQVILLSTGISREEVQKALQSGVNRIIAEPFNPSVLASKLEDILPGGQKTLESRRFLRKSVSGSVKLRIESEITDISEGGMRILTNMPLRTGEIITFELDVFRSLGIGGKSGKVVWISGNDSRDAFLYQAGIDFADMTTTELNRLRRWIHRL